MADPTHPRPDDAPREAADTAPAGGLPEGDGAVPRRSTTAGAPDGGAGSTASGATGVTDAAPTSPAERAAGTTPAGATPGGPDPVPDEAEPTPVPDEAELERTAEPARVRRAPKTGAFIVAGALVGIVLGLVVALLTAPGSAVEADGTAFISVLEGQGVIRFLSALTGGVVGGFVGGGTALLADRRSLRDRRDGTRR